MIPRNHRVARARDFPSTATDPGAELDSKSGGGFLMSSHCVIEETEKGLGPKVNSDLVA